MYLSLALRAWADDLVHPLECRRMRNLACLASNAAAAEYVFPDYFVVFLIIIHTVDLCKWGHFIIVADNHQAQAPISHARWLTS